MNSVAFTGGGSGGHVYPGLAVLRKLQTIMGGNPPEVFWIGAKKGIEREIVEKEVVPFYRIPAGKLRRYFSFRNFFDLFKVIGGIFGAFFILLQKRPQLLFSKGGFVSVPPVIAARLLKIPVITHESDFDPGLATRINSRFASKICLAYEESRSFFGKVNQDKIEVTGNPVREDMYTADPAKGRERFSIPEGKPLILVIGGSLGASQINVLIRGCLPDLLDKAVIVHQTGSTDYSKSEDDNYRVYPYIHEGLADLMAAADIIVIRAGAGLLWEIATLGKAAILIPLGKESSRGDQLRNAHFFEKAGAAKVLSGKQVTSENLRALLKELLDEKKERKILGAAASELGRKNGALQIAEILKKQLEKNA
jgi:UDP-N-acetylglucosamine--N-acetylmuramyl-(pentapeptide) pyrophosphoryl-undecaprenol N-acetylglucosamine transferase